MNNIDDNELDNIEFKEYSMIFTVLYGDSVNQLRILSLFTEKESALASENLNKCISKLVSTNNPQSLSIVTRNKAKELVYHGITGIVGIEHNVSAPEMYIDD